jgi:hypothetical protein
MSLGEYIGAGAAITKGLWHLNGNSLDSSGNGANGTDTAITYGLQYGRFGQGASFNGTTSKIHFTSRPILGATAITMSAWVNNVDTSARPIYWSGLGGAGQDDIDFLLYWNNSFINFSLWDSSGGMHYILGNTILATHTWYNVIGTWSSGNIMKIYINGVDDGISSSVTPTWSGGIRNTATTFDIGMFRSSNYFYGSMDELIIENRACTQQMIDRYYAQSRGRYAPRIG